MNPIFDSVVSFGLPYKLPRLGGLNNMHVFLTILKAGKLKIKVLVDPVSVSLFMGGHPLPVSSPGKEQRKRKQALMAFYKGTNPIH